MFANFSQFVLGQDNGGEGIVELIIFVFIIVAGIIKSLFAANQEQKRKQIQKKPSSYPSSQKKPFNAEKIKMQTERYEKILNSILQPKKTSQQQQQPKPATLRPKSADTTPIPFPQRANPPVAKVYADQSGSVAYSTTNSAAWHSQAEELLDTKMPDIPAIPSIDTKIEQIPQFKEEHIQEDQRHLISHENRPRGKAASRKSTDSLFAFSDSDDFKKMILYTEILGKPIALRESEVLFE